MRIKKILYFIIFFITINLSYSQHGKFSVVLDAGHGGKDPGKVQGRVFEKNIVLNIVLLVGNELKKDPNFKVIYTRDDDTFVELYERGAIANKAKADLFVSVHCNAVSNPKIKGTEVYVLGLNSAQVNLEVSKAENDVMILEDGYKEKYAKFDSSNPESFMAFSLMQEESLTRSIKLANFVLVNFEKSMNMRNRNARQANFIVLHQASMPSVLIETGFMTNEDELKFLNSEDGQRQVAENIVKSIKDYYNWVRNNTSWKYEEEREKAAEKIIEKVDNKVVIDKKSIVEAKKKDEIVFKVQISSSSRDLELLPENFKGLNKVSKEPFNKLFRYYYEKATPEIEEAKKHRQEAVEAGFKDAFLVPYLNGIRSKMEDVIDKIK